MNKLKLYAFQPDGYGPKSFYVMATSEENARIAINKYIEDYNKRQKEDEEIEYYSSLDDYETDYLSSCKPLVLDENEVVINDNY